MKKLLTLAVMAATICLTGLVMSGEAQSQRLVDNGNGTVTDTVTRLMWSKDANPFDRLPWDDAMSRCSSFSISGIGGWRLPSRDELVNLSHAIQGEHPFTGVRQYYYWSSTTYAGDTDFAWYVYIGSGSVKADPKGNSNHVWPVR